jgi:hypothetical protein
LGIFQVFGDRRERAWERVYELEEKRDPRGAIPDPKRVEELHEGPDIAALTRLWETAREEHEAAVVEAPRARRRAMLRFELPVAATGLVILAALAAINYLWLGALGVDYFDSYLESGFLVSLVFGVVAVAIDLDSQPNLIAAHPGIYLAETFVLLRNLAGALEVLFERPRSERTLAQAGLAVMGYRYRLRTLDLALSWLFMLSFAAATLAWALLIAPLQYWLYLVCAAPAREALASSKTLWVVRSATGNELLFAPKDPNEFEKRELQKAHEQGDMTEVGFAAKPVSFTAAIATAVLFGISRFV